MDPSHCIFFTAPNWSRLGMSEVINIFTYFFFLYLIHKPPTNVISKETESNLVRC